MNIQELLESNGFEINDAGEAVYTSDFTNEKDALNLLKKIKKISPLEVYLNISEPSYGDEIEDEPWYVADFFFNYENNDYSTVESTILSILNA